MLTSRIKSFWLVATLLIFILLSLPLQSSAETQLNPSPALQTIFKQADDTYFGPPIINATLNDAFNQAPEIFAMAVGMTLQRQKLYASSQLKYYPRYNKLLKEAESFMKQAAKAHNYKHPGDGSPLPEERMVAEFLNGLNGNRNQQFTQKFGIDPTRVDLPLMLTQVPPPKSTSNNGEMGKLQVKKDQDNLNLLGLEGTSSGLDTDIKSWQTVAEQEQYRICPEKNRSQSRNYFNIRNENDPAGTTDTQCVYFGVNGPLKEQNHSVNNKWQGVRLRYRVLDSGQHYLWLVEHYTNGIQQGDNLGYELDKTGKIRLTSKIPYLNGKRNGVQISWSLSKAGRPYVWMKTSYVDGKRNGPEEEYLLSDSEQRWLSSKIMYVNNKRHGFTEYWRLSKTGQHYLESRTSYKDDKYDGPDETYELTDSGQHWLRSTIMFSKGEENGIAEIWKLKDGQRVLSARWNSINGKIHGIREGYKTSSKTGQTWIESRDLYSHGELCKMTYFSIDGRVRMVVPGKGNCH